MNPSRSMSFIAALTALCIGVARAAAPPPGADADADHDASRFVLLEPVRDATEHPIVERAPDGAEVPVVRRIVAGRLYEQARSILSTGLSARLPALDGDARNASASTECDGIGRVVIIFLSDEDGGFARRGFFLQQPNGPTHYCADYYVDVTVDESDIASGEFEEVLGHEFGHIILRRLMGPVPPTATRHFHNVSTMTDPTTAFDEGFGEHFQPLAAQYSTTAGFRRRLEPAQLPTPAEGWLSRRESWVREASVPRGLMLYDKADVRTGNADPYDNWSADETTLTTDPCRLRTGSQMMASEGVAASVFYHLAFVAGATPGPATGTGADAMEAAYAKLIATLGQGVAWRSRAPLLDLIRAWSARYPTDRVAVTKAFLELTAGATASDEVRRLYKIAACHAALGHREKFVATRNVAAAALEQLTGDVLAGRKALDGALGPELWIANPSIRIPDAPWSPTRNQPFVADLSTARVPALTLMLSGVPQTEAIARKIVSARARGGDFRDLPDLASRARLGNEAMSRITALAGAFAALPPYTRK